MNQTSWGLKNDLRIKAHHPTTERWFGQVFSYPNYISVFTTGTIPLEQEVHCSRAKQWYRRKLSSTRITLQGFELATFGLLAQLYWHIEPPSDAISSGSKQQPLNYKPICVATTLPQKLPFNRQYVSKVAHGTSLHALFKGTVMIGNKITLKITNHLLWGLN